MSSFPPSIRRAGPWLAVALLITAGTAFAVRLRGRDEDPGVTVPAPVAEASPAEVKHFCAACHTYPSPEIFPRSVWRKEIRQAYDFLRDSSLSLDYPSFEAVVRYYEDRAPGELVVPRGESSSSCPIQFEKSGHAAPGLPPQPGVANVTLARLFGGRGLDVLVCDMRFGKVLAFQPYLSPPVWRTLAEVPHPAHAEVVDLDGDGRLDVIVANLGDFAPTDERVGSIVWLRQSADGSFAPVTLLDGVGRVADVQVADFNRDGKPDLIAAVFGWRTTGEIVYLENRTTDWSKPMFVPHVLDERHGSIHVPVADLNGDGRPDFVALISQEHETVVAFLNEGGGRFRKETLYAAPHPAFGSSGIQIVDLDGDGRDDVLFTNGDSLQKPYVLKPYHGVHWLENKGGLRFEHHELTAMPGAMRAVAADFRGAGRKDIVAVSYLPAHDYPQRESVPLDAIVLLRQTEPGKFERHVLASGSCDHLTCAAGDVFGDGRNHFVVGNFTISPAHPLRDSIQIWRNLGSGR